jgi:hypothetical protein
MLQPTDGVVTFSCLLRCGQHEADVLEGGDFVVRAHDVLPDGTERVQTEAIRAVETEMT